MRTPRNTARTCNARQTIIRGFPRATVQFDMGTVNGSPGKIVCARVIIFVVLRHFSSFFTWFLKSDANRCWGCFSLLTQLFRRRFSEMLKNCLKRFKMLKIFWGGALPPQPPPGLAAPGPCLRGLRPWTPLVGGFTPHAP